MAYFIVPKNVTQSKVTLWVGDWVGLPQKTNFELILKKRISLYDRSPKEIRRVTLINWKRLGRVSDGIPALKFLNIDLDGLQPNINYWVSLHTTTTDQEWATAEFKTLPNSLSSNGKPFTVLLGSCYWYGKDKKKQVAKNYETVYKYGKDASPDLKLLVGDQVYVDQDGWENPFTSPGETSISLAKEQINKVYYKSWHQLQTLLSYGANVFMSDDHEFWNDYPRKPLKNWAGLQDYLSVGNVKLVATDYFKAVQNNKATFEFDIGEQLSFFVADMRINRDSKGKSLMKPHDFQQLIQWIKNLQTPGVLVINSPLLWGPLSKTDVDGFFVFNWFKTVAEVLSTIFLGPIGLAAGWLTFSGLETLAIKWAGKISDHNIPSYSDARILSAAISQSPHDLLILSGDIHMGRICNYRVHRKDGNDPVNVHEVTSSPMSILGNKKEPDYKDVYNNPTRFPIYPEPLTHVYPAKVIYKRNVPFPDSKNEEHFTTLEFRSGNEKGSIDVSVSTWLTKKPNYDNANKLKPVSTYAFSLDKGRLPKDGKVEIRKVTGVLKHVKGYILALFNPSETWSPRYIHEVRRDLKNELVEYIRADNGEAVSVIKSQPYLANFDGLPFLYPNFLPSILNDIYDGAIPDYQINMPNSLIDIYEEEKDILTKAQSPIWFEPVLGLIMQN
jgi:hypothetical protein